MSRQKDEAPQILFEAAGFPYILRWKLSLQAKAEQQHPSISARHQLSTHTALRGWELQEAQAAHRLNTISSQGSKMIIDFILIGLSAMSQFKC